MKILGEQKPINVFCEASRILNESVEHTLGPKGTNTAVCNSEGRYEIINDGKSIIEQITSLDPAIAPALETLKQASFETNRKAGDGTTSTTVIMNKLLQGAKKFLEEETAYSETELRNLLEEIKTKLLDILEEVKVEVKEEDYVKVAEVALGSPKYAETVADIFKFLGKGRKPALIKSDVTDIEVEKIDGINLTKTKIVSNLFLETTEHRDVNVLCLFEPINRFQELTQLLRKIQQSNKETLLFYNQLSTDILENILFNYTNGAIKLIPICLGGYGAGTYSIMQELADYCDCNVIDNTNCKVSEISKIIFGHVDYGVVNADQIVLKNLEKFNKNYVHLNERSVIIRIGGTNVVEREEVYRRIEDAINSLSNAIEFGMVPGAGETYSLLIDRLVENRDLYVPGFVVDAMKIIKKRVNITELNGIYDSASVVAEVIKNAFSIVSQVITTRVVIHENIR